MKAPLLVCVAFASSLFLADAAIISAPPGNINVRKESSVKRAVKNLAATANVSAGWTGNVGVGNAGTVSDAYQQTTLQGVNVFRKLAGLPPVVIDTSLSTKCAKAALMMSANKQLSHTPPPSWTFYTADGAEAAENSNLFLGLAGPLTIPGYIEDSGVGNEIVGHRRWILWSQSQIMGTGDVLDGSGFPAANALWVLPIGPSPGPSTRGGFVAWPYAGAIPNTLVFQRWSFAVPFGDFSSAKISVKLGNKSIPTRVIDRSTSGVGDNALIFQPKLGYIEGKPGSYFYQQHLRAPTKTATYSVTVSNVKLATGAMRTFKYRVLVFPMK